MTDIDEIKRRLNIEDVIGEHIKLQKSGANFRARCPFHVEKTPSFFVSPEKQIWHCFGGCQKGGDIFRFLMEIEGIEFGEALRMLAGRAGVQLRRFDERAHDQKSVIFRINELATFFFKKALEKSEGGEKALRYLRERGVSEESIERFKLGWAPSAWRSLLAFFQEKGYRKEDIISAGLGIQNEEGRVYDRFRARIMFPIQSPVGHIVGFTGRTLLGDAKEAKPSEALGGGGAKYINTPQTLVYDKSSELYGIYQAKQAIKNQDEALLVEGNLDVILSSQAGVENVVATSGTALTQRHLQTIGRYTKNIVFCFDNDAAGIEASKRAFELALQSQFDVHTLVLTKGKDPAEIVVKEGDNAWRDLSTKKQHLIEFLWASGIRNYDVTSLKGKKALTNELFRFLVAMPNRIERGYWIGVIANRLRLREEDVREEFQKFEIIDKGLSKIYNHDETVISPLRDRVRQDKENLASLILFYPQLRKEMPKQLGFSRIHKEVEMSKDELLLKAEVFWPTEHMAKRELVRIINHLTFVKKKEEAIKKVQS